MRTLAIGKIATSLMTSRAKPCFSRVATQDAPQFLSINCCQNVRYLRPKAGPGEVSTWVPLMAA